jgi:hypothetical protein
LRIAEPILDQDYCLTFPVCDTTFDEFSRPKKPARDYLDLGPILDYVDFLCLNNPFFDTFHEHAALRLEVIFGLERPDIITDDPSKTPARREFYEIKPDSNAGRAAGFAKIAEIKAFMDVRGFPYKPGTKWDPATTLIDIDTVLGIPFEMRLKARRIRSKSGLDGLIVYALCVKGEFEKVPLPDKEIIAALIAMLLATRSPKVPGGTPPSLPIPVPVPVPFPEPIPIPL